MSDAATMVRYVDAANDNLLAAVWAYEMPCQSDWTYIEDTAYKVYDVIHTVFPNREQMVSTILLWEPNPEATDDAINKMYERSVAARTGEMSLKSPPVQDGGERTEIIHNNNKLSDVTLSAFPSDSEKRECVHVTGQSGPFVISDISHWVEDGEQETAIFLFEVEDGKASARMANIQSHLKGQRDSARNRVLEDEGPEAYQEMLDRIKEQTD